MSLSIAISNAMSGLGASSRGTEVVSTNIANKSVAGYARRELAVSSSALGGVTVDGVRRMVSAGLLADDRLAQAASAHSGAIASFHGAIETALQTEDEAGSIGSLVAGLGTALAAATSDPASDTRLAQVADAAGTLAKRVNDVAQVIQDARTGADKAIAGDVETLNTTLERVAALNRQITVVTARGEDASALMDSRQAAIDQIAKIVPVQEVARENGRVALFTTGGTTLLDGSTPARIGFSAASIVTPDMTLANGALSGLSIDGRSLGAADMGQFAGGSLAAQFQVRDELAPAYQAQVDAFAADLYARFANPAVDPTLAVGEAGLFTDGQGSLQGTLGLANRLSLNRLADPSAGGEAWRLRAGLNATAAGSAGDSSLLLRLGTALSENRAPASAVLSGSAGNVLNFAANLASAAASQRVRAETVSFQDQSHAEGIRTALLAQGVDEDTEMSTLLALEKAYGANAKVFQIANDMLDQILGLR